MGIHIHQLKLFDCISSHSSSRPLLRSSVNLYPLIHVSYDYKKKKAITIFDNLWWLLANLNIFAETVPFLIWFSACWVIISKFGAMHTELDVSYRYYEKIETYSLFIFFSKTKVYLLNNTVKMSRYALQWESKILIAVSTAIQDWITSSNWFGQCHCCY